MILEYPELIYFITTSNPEHTYTYLRRTYNGIQELEKREDAANVLLSKLATVSKDETNIIMRTYLSNLLCTPVISEQLTPVQEKQFLELTGMDTYLSAYYSTTYAATAESSTPEFYINGIGYVRANKQRQHNRRQ